MSTVTYAGLDVAKATLALHLAGQHQDLPNTPAGHVRLVRLLQKHPGVQLLCEASGGYEQAPVRALWAAGLPVSIVEAGRVRHYARACGRHAKNDPIDAKRIAQFGAAVRPRPTPPPTAVAQRLAALVQRRRQLQQTLVAEVNRAAHYTDKLLRRQSAQLLRLLRAQVQTCAAEAARLIAATPELGRLSDGAIAACLRKLLILLNRLLKNPSFQLAG